MNEQIAKAIIGNMLKRARTDNGHAQKEVAILLGLPNPNYISMIEKGTNYIPIKRVWDFVGAYRLTKIQGLAVLKLTSDDMWVTLLQGLEACGVSKANLQKLSDDAENVIKEEARRTGIELL